MGISVPQRLRPPKVKLLSAIWCFEAQPLFAPDYFARGLICSALNRFSLDGDCHSPYSQDSLCDRCFCSIQFWSASLCPYWLSHILLSPFGAVGKVGLDNCIPLHEGSAPNLRCDVQLLSWITKSSISMEATWLTVEKKVERCDWFGYQPPTAVGLHRRGQSLTPQKVGSSRFGLSPPPVRDFRPSRHLKSEGGSSSRGGN